MALIGMSIISYYKNHVDKCDDTDVPATIKLLSGMISTILIPMLESMADHEIDNNDVTA